MSNAFDRRRQRNDASLAHLGMQLADLYGPLTCLMHEGEQAFRDLQTVLGDVIRIEGGSPDDPTVETWLFWAESVFLPRNQRIMDLLASQMHLIEGTSLPQSYVLFIKHHQSWVIRHQRWKSEGVEYNWHSTVDWPDEFQRDVLQTFDALKGRQSALLANSQRQFARRVIGSHEPS